MQLKVGEIVEGTVKSLTKFGAFVALDATTTGLVHISEVAHAYVSDIHDYLTEGQTVKVMVIGLENGKINLSIKRLEPKPQREQGGKAPFRGGNNQPRREGFQNREGNRPNRENPRPQQQRAPMQPAAPKTADQLFEEKLKAFMSESDNKLSSMRADHRTKSRRR